MHAAVREALRLARNASNPAIPWEKLLPLTRGFGPSRLRRTSLNACGYSLGPRFTLLDGRPYVLQNAPTVVEPGMVFFLHMILMDSDTQTAMCLGRTSLVTQSGSNRSRGCRSRCLGRQNKFRTTPIGTSRSSCMSFATTEFVLLPLKHRCMLGIARHLHRCSESALASHAAYRSAGPYAAQTQRALQTGRVDHQHEMPDIQVFTRSQVCVSCPPTPPSVSMLDNTSTIMAKP